MASIEPADDAVKQIDYRVIFEAFAQAMRDDYVDDMRIGARVACRDYLESYTQIAQRGEGGNLQLARCLEEYLLAFGNPAVRLWVDHARVARCPAYTWGMSMRAHGDALYVTHALPGCALQPGDRIVGASMYAEAEFYSIAELRQRFRTSLGGPQAEREQWDPLLHYANRYLVAVDNAASEQGPDVWTGTPTTPAPPAVMRDSTAPANRLSHATDAGQSPGSTRHAASLMADGNFAEQAVAVDLSSVVIGRAASHAAKAVGVRRVKMRRLVIPAPGITCDLRRLDGGVALLTLRGLSRAKALASFMAEAARELDAAPAIVIDARRCSGGTAEALAGILPYVVEKPTVPASYMERTCLTNHSLANARRRAAALDLLTAGDAGMPTTDGATEADLFAKAGLGLVEEPREIPGALWQTIAPRGSACKVALLTDTLTCGAAELLAEVAQDSGRCVTVGRATRGGQGYLNPAVLDVGGFCLQYPVSRFTDEGLARHFAGVGVPPQVHVPWSPEHCRRDLDLEAALQALA